MNTKLITALRTSAKALENDTFGYNWNEAHSCNCGILCCALFGKSLSDMEKLLEENNIYGQWAEAVQEYCPVTGTSTNKIFKELMSYGLSPADIVQLENLSSPAVIARMGLTETVTRTTRNGWFKKPIVVTETVPTRPEYNRKEHLIKYLRTWADMLQEEGRMDAPVSEAEPELTHHPI